MIGNQKYEIRRHQRTKILWKNSVVGLCLLSITIHTSYTYGRTYSLIRNSLLFRHSIFKTVVLWLMFCYIAPIPASIFELLRILIEYLRWCSLFEFPHLCCNNSSEVFFWLFLLFNLSDIFLISSTKIKIPMSSLIIYANTFGWPEYRNSELRRFDLYEQR